MVAVLIISIIITTIGLLPHVIVKKSFERWYKMSNKMSDKLLPCPFCGGEVKIRGGAEDWVPTFYDPDSGGDPYYISCECGLSFSIDSYEVEELVTAWNTRKLNEGNKMYWQWSRFLQEMGKGGVI